MNQKSKEYLESFDPPLEAPLRRRIDEVVEVFKWLRKGRDPALLFLSDTIDGDGARAFVSLWAFDDPVWMEARSFTTQIDVDVSLYNGAITYVGVEDDEKSPVEGVDSRPEMRVQVETDSGTYSLLSATGDNKAYLRDIVAETLVPALKKT